MNNLLQSKVTRFRAYQLGSPGSSFSYFDGAFFTLIEARITDLSRPQLKQELQICGKTKINCLHITSWDNDHCANTDLNEILTTLEPAKLEYPGYPPHTETGKKCLEMIAKYELEQRKKIVKIDPPYIASLNTATGWGYTDIVYWPKILADDKPNDNSTAKLFRTGSFNVLSLGDLESAEIANHFKSCPTLKSETDIMILAHHGADNGFTTKALLERINPRVTICTSDFDNQFEHPKQEIRDLLYELEIPVFTTKTGDVIIMSETPHTHKYTLWNLKTDSTDISSKKEFKSKKSQFLNNSDRAANHYGKQTNPFKRYY